MDRSLPTLLASLFALLRISGADAQSVLIAAEEQLFHAGATATLDGGAVIVTTAADVLRLDPVGMPLWQEHLAIDPLLHPAAELHVLAASNGHFLVHGPAVDTAGAPAFHIVDLDPDGVVQWSRSYPIGLAQTASHVVERQDGTFSAGFTAIVQGTVCVVIAHLGPGGAPISATAYRSSGLGTALSGSLLALSDGGLAFCGISDLDMQVARLGASGQVMWARTVVSPSGSRLEPHALAESGDGGLVACAHNYAGDQPIPDLIPVALKFDEEGDQVWQNTYTPEIAEASFWDIRSSASGDLVFTGVNGVGATLRTDGNGAPINGRFFAEQASPWIQPERFGAIACDEVHTIRAGQFLIGGVDAARYLFFEVLDTGDPQSCLSDALELLPVPYGSTMEPEQYTLLPFTLGSVQVNTVAQPFAVTTNDLCIVLGDRPSATPYDLITVSPTLVQHDADALVTVTADAPLDLTLWTAEGRLLRTQAASRETRATMDLTGCAPGCYVLRVRSGKDGTLHTSRIIVH